MNYKNMEGKDGRGTPAAGAAAPLVRQLSSVYSLTFDEFQSTLGREFGSMNMDELLRSIWSAEDEQAMVAAATPLVDPASGIQRQGSLTLPRTLSQKTVDEVWRGLMVRDAAAGGAGSAAMASTPGFQPKREPTLGEMTLEEFLVRAGVVREDITEPQMQLQPVNNIANGGSSVFYGDLPIMNNAAGIALGFAQIGQTNRGAAPSLMPSNPGANLGMPVTNQAVMQHAGGVIGVGDVIMNGSLMQGAVGLGGGAVTVGAVGLGGGVTVGSSPQNQMASDMHGKSNGEMSSVSPVPYVLNGGIRRKRAGGPLEKVVERRQRRMIKNRESAARSRARKQAYTTELEAEVAKLKEQNQELQKKQAELMEMQKNKVLETINQQYGQKRRCLRRTMTGPW